MKKDQLLDMLGEIDNKYLEEALGGDPEKPIKLNVSRAPVKWYHIAASIAACFVLCAGVFILSRSVDQSLVGPDVSSTSTSGSSTISDSGSQSTSSGGTQSSSSNSTESSSSSGTQSSSTSSQSSSTGGTQSSSSTRENPTTGGGDESGPVGGGGFYSDFPPFDSVNVPTVPNISSVVSEIVSATLYTTKFGEYDVSVIAGTIFRVERDPDTIYAEELALCLVRNGQDISRALFPNTDPELAELGRHAIGANAGYISVNIFEMLDGAVAAAKLDNTSDMGAFFSVRNGAIDLLRGVEVTGESVSEVARFSSALAKDGNSLVDPEIRREYRFYSLEPHELYGTHFYNIDGANVSGLSGKIGIKEDVNGTVKDVETWKNYIKNVNVAYIEFEPIPSGRHTISAVNASSFMESLASVDLNAVGETQNPDTGGSAIYVGYDANGKCLFEIVSNGLFMATMDNGTRYTFEPVGLFNYLILDSDKNYGAFDIGGGNVHRGGALDRSSLVSFSLEDYLYFSDRDKDDPASSKYSWRREDIAFADSLNDGELRETFQNAQILMSLLSTANIQPMGMVNANDRSASSIITSSGKIYYESGCTYESFYNTFLSAFTKEETDKLLASSGMFMEYNGELYYRQGYEEAEVEEVHREYEITLRSDTAVEISRNGFNANVNIPTSAYREEDRDKYTLVHTDYRFVKTDDGWRAERIG